MFRIPWLKILFGLVTLWFLAMLYFPFAIMAILSFQGPSGSVTFPLREPSLIWWHELIRPGASPVTRDVGQFITNYWSGLAVSLVMAITTSLVATTLAFLAVQGFRRGFRGQTAVFYLFVMGIAAPGIVVSLGMGQILFFLEIDRNWYTSALVLHIMYALPFCFIFVLVLFRRFDHRLEEAAMTLGADPITTFFKVTLPVMTPALRGSLLFGFTLSFDEYERTAMVIGSQLTLPIQLFNTITIRVTPLVYALGMVITTLSFTLFGLYIYSLARTMWRRKFSVVL
jgi:putative spermidine/putrescine transport system permease protein